MLPKQLLFVYSFLLIASSGFAQKPLIERKQAEPVTNITSETLNQVSPFTRNFNQFIIQQNFDFSRIKPENSDGHTTNANANFNYTRFIADHIGVGAEFDLSSSKSEYGNSTTKDNRWMVYGDVLYGTTFNDFNLYGKLSVGFGKDKNEYGSTTVTEDLFGYKFEVGSPVHLPDGGNYITPFISYNFLQQKNSGAKNKETEFELGFRFENYAPCSSYACDCHHGRSFSRNTYDQGRSFIGYSSMGNFGFGNSKFEYGNSEAKSDISGGQLNFEYGYYFIPNLAIGAGVNWNSQTEKTNGSKYTSSSLTFMPMLTFNLPVDNCWNNLFLQGGYGFGSQKFSTGPNDQKSSLTNYCFYIGFNDYFGKHIAFTPKFGYDWETEKDKTTDIKTKWSGPELSLGVSLHY